MMQSQAHPIYFFIYHDLQVSFHYANKGQKDRTDHQRALHCTHPLNRCIIVHHMGPSLLKIVTETQQRIIYVPVV